MLYEESVSNGCSLEEKYFLAESRRLIDEIKKDPLKIRRAIRELSADRGTKNKASAAGASADQKQLRTAA